MRLCETNSEKIKIENMELYGTDFKKWRKTKKAKLSFFEKIKLKKSPVRQKLISLLWHNVTELKKATKINSPAKNRLIHYLNSLRYLDSSHHWFCLPTF